MVQMVRLSYISQYSLCQSCLLSGAPVHHTGEKTMVQIDWYISHTASVSLAYYLVPLYTIQGTKLVNTAYIISQHSLCQSCLLSGAPVHHTGEKTMVQIGQIVVHLTTQPLPVLLIIWCPCTPYRGRNYGTNRSDCRTSHNTASASLAYYLPLYTIHGTKLWYK